MDRKKALKEEYKKRKSDMGVYRLTFVELSKVYLGISEDLKGSINSLKFQLKLGSFRNRKLQSDYNKYGLENMRVEVEEYLEYKNDTEDENYIEELEELRVIISEKYPDNEFIKYRKSKK